MCAIYGFYELTKGKPVKEGALEAMLRPLRHRGPDETGAYEKQGLSLGHARLSIVGLDNGRQPLFNEDESVALVYAGEIFNYKELRETLERKGHRFRTLSDGEVITHLYEEEGMDFLEKLNGQFAFALWDTKRCELILCRDRLGILPLFFAQKGSLFLFASEIKGLLGFPGLDAELDPKTLAQIFTFWTPLPGATMFKDIFQLEPGTYLRVTPLGREVRRYWDLRYPKKGEAEEKKESVWLESLGGLLEDAVRIRLQADVPVGVYLSGGLDSSAVAAMAAEGPLKPKSFSVQFQDPAFDESRYQALVTRHLGLENSHVRISQDDLARALPRAVYHSESPVLRLAMTPLYLLSRAVHQNHFKAVLTGEGADEMLLGYDIFKEVKIRQFSLKFPGSKARPRLFERLYPHLALPVSGGGSFLRDFFTQGSEESLPAGQAGASWDSSHSTRWRNTMRLQRFFSAEMKDTFRGYDPQEELRSKLPADFTTWDAMAKAQYLECRLFLSNYLLSSQGDRMSMANSVEARYPYLDHRVVELANRMPASVKMKGLREKAALKKCVEKRLPKEVLERLKYPYRAPGLSMTPVSKEAVSETRLKESGLWDENLVKLLIEKALKAAEAGAPLSEADQMAVSGILTSQIFHSIFIRKEEVQLV